jgi:predicted nucleic acid-binding protein
MANLIIPDSSIFIDATRAGLDPFVEFGAHVEECEFATCGMIVLEVTRGLRFPKILQSFRERFAVMVYIPTTNQIWERASQLAWALDRQGVVLPAQDILIASHALHADAIVLTHDAHFSSVPGLRVTDRLG